jgi:hypothetical protein
MRRVGEAVKEEGGGVSKGKKGGIKRDEACVKEGRRNVLASE